MPELPEVEVTRQNLSRWMTGHAVEAVEIHDATVLRGAKKKALLALHGRFERAERRGKYLLLTFEKNQGLLAHLGMTGKFVRRTNDAPERFARVSFTLEDGARIHYADARKFGQIQPVPADNLLKWPAVQKLGPDPLFDGLDWQTLKAALLKTRQPLKVALMDQHRIAGIGNIYAAEALFRAGLHPSLKPQALEDAAWKKLTRAVHASLKFGLTRAAAEEVRYLGDGSGLTNPFHVYDRAGTACRRCKTDVRSFTQAGRTTHFCPTCQPRRTRSVPARASIAR